jgi:LSD1 subclass zinc finger protein
MELSSISCGNCGAPLHIPPSARFITCNQCQSQLAVKHSESVTWTEKLEQLDARTERIEEELSHLRYQNELANLDRQWEREREKYMVTDKHGRRREPSVAASIVGGVLAVGMGVFLLATGFQGFGGMALGGLVFILVGIGGSLYSYVRAKDYLAAQRSYRRRRYQLRKR